jgi:hypothetical protein
MSPGQKICENIQTTWYVLGRKEYLVEVGPQEELRGDQEKVWRMCAPLIPDLTDDSGVVGHNKYMLALDGVLEILESQKHRSQFQVVDVHGLLGNGPDSLCLSIL